MTTDAGTVCSGCGTTNPARQKFCGECGTRLLVPAAVPSAAIATASYVVESVAATPPPAPIVEERRLITALFCDLVGFTPLTESLDPEEVRQIQGMYFERMSEQLHRYGGSVEKYAGDAVLALFGNPVAHEDDPERAVRCALAMQQAFRAVAEMTKRAYGKDVAVRIGVNTGEVISGAWDVEGRLDYSATGDALNTAARLQTAAEPGGVIVGPETMHLARRAIRFGPRMDLTLKGKSELFPAYAVLGLREEIAERWEAQEQRSPLVGRERELALLLETWTRVRAGEGRMVTLVAEAGVGKSRLLAEAIESMSAVAGTVALRARASSHGEGMSLYLVADLLRSICQLHEGDSADRVRDQLGVTIEALLAPQDDATRAAARDVMGTVLGLPPGPSEVTHAGPQVRRQTLVRSLQLLLAALSTYRPAILLLEDLHWMDSASAEVMGAVLPALRDRLAMVLASHRPGRTMPWEAWPENQTVHLEPLGDRDALELARSVLRGAAFEPELQQQVTDRAGGNPFFVEELLRNLQETGALEVRDGRLGLRPGAAAKLPTTLTELLMARLDQLDWAARSTAQLGSVIGRTFAVPLLARIAQQDAPELRAPLDRLERAEIAFARHNPEQEYVFKHATVREVAYNALLQRRRQELHAATARALIELDPTEEQVEVIAYHFGRTQQHLEAAIWLERSGDRAASVYANHGAIDQYREARRRQELIDAPQSDRARLDEKLGHILRVVLRYEEGLEALEAAFDAYHAVHDLEGERRVTAEIGRVHRARGTPEEGVPRVKQLLERQSQHAPTGGMAALHVVLARLYYNLGRHQEQLEAATLGSQLAAQADDRRVLAEAEMSRSVALYHLRRTEDALQAMEAAIPVAEGVEDFEVLSALLNNTAMIYRDMGQFERSRQFRERSAYIAERVGDLGMQAQALANLGEVFFCLGDWQEAQAQLQRAEQLFRSQERSWFSLQPSILLGQLHAARGEFEIAAANLEAALAFGRESGNRLLMVLPAAFMAELEILRGQPDAALGHLAEIMDFDAVDEDDGTLTGVLPIAAAAALEHGDVARAAALSALGTQRAVEEQAIVEAVTSQRVLGAAAAAEGEWTRAEDLFERALTLAQQMTHPYAEARILYEYGLMSLKRGDLSQARRHLEAALRIFGVLGARPYIERTERALAQLEAE